MVYPNGGDFLRRILVFSLNGRNFQWNQFVGAFLGIITLLFLVKSAAVMFDSWQSVRNFNDCANTYLDGLNAAQVSNNPTLQVFEELRYQRCRDALFEITGTQIPGTQITMTSRQVASALLGPIAIFFFWFGLFLVSLVLLFSKVIAIPIEEIEITHKPFRKK